MNKRVLLLATALGLLSAGCTSVRMASWGQTFDQKTGTILTNGTSVTLTTWGGGRQTVEALKASGGRTSAVGATSTDQNADMTWIAPAMQAMFEAGKAAK